MTPVVVVKDMFNPPAPYTAWSKDFTFHGIIVEVKVIRPSQFPTIVASILEEALWKGKLMKVGYKSLLGQVSKIDGDIVTIEYGTDSCNKKRLLIGVPIAIPGRGWRYERTKEEKVNEKAEKAKM